MNDDSSSGEWIIKDEKKSVKGHLDIPELSFGELHDLHQVNQSPIITSLH